jgi:hypothetical protein
MRTQLSRRRLLQICLFTLICGLAFGASGGSTRVHVPGAEGRPGTAGMAGGNGRFCRAELSVFYHGMQSLGDVWGRTACPFESDPLSASAVADMRAALADAVNGLGVFPPGCIPFDVAVIKSLSNRLPSLTRVQIEQEVRVNIILKLQQALAEARFTCDHGVNPSALFVAGVHLGAAQAFASCFLCHPPIPAAFQTVMANHLKTAHDALVPYAACIPNFDFNTFGKVPLGSTIPGEPHTHVVGIETQLLWSITLSDCCCTCAATPNRGTSGCFASDPAMASTNRNDHYSWAQQQSPAAIEANLQNKINLLFNCSAMTDAQLACAFADYSVTIARYVQNANCFNGDPGAINTGYSAHRDWARTKSRSQVLSNLQSKVAGAFKCLNRAAQSSFFADMSVVTAKAPLNQNCADSKLGPATPVVPPVPTTPTRPTTPTTPTTTTGPLVLQLVDVKQDPPCKTWGNITSCDPNGGHVSWYNTNYQWNSPPQQVGTGGFTITLNVSQNRPGNDRVATGLNMSGAGFDLNPANPSIPIGAPNQPMSGSLTVTVKPPKNPSGDYYLKIGVFWGPGWTYHYRAVK